MVNKLNQSKDSLLTKLKKINNKELAKLGDMVHKKCNLSANRFLIVTRINWTSSHKYFFICHKEWKRWTVINSNSRFDILAKTNIFIVKGSRLCRCHLDEKGFVIEKDLFLVQSFDGEVTFDENSINELIAMYKQS